MFDKAMRSLVLLILTMGLPQTGVLRSESLPPRALTRIGDHRLYHGPGVGCAALSPDGRYVASAANYWDGDSNHVANRDLEDYNCVIVLWDAVSGERLRELRVSHSSVCCLAFSPDGKRLAAAHDRPDKQFDVVLFAVETGKLQLRLKEFKRSIDYLQFSADGKQLRVSEHRGAVSAWEATTGKQLHLWNSPVEKPLVGHKRRLSGLEGMLSADGKLIAWEMGYLDNARAGRLPSVGLRVHDAVTDKLLFRIIVKPNSTLNVIGFSADGKRLVGYDDNDLRVWDTTNGKERLAGQSLGAGSFALTPDGRRVALYPNFFENAAFALPLWDLDGGKLSRELRIDYFNLGDRGEYEPLPRQQAFSADGKTLLLAMSPTLHLVDTTTGKERFRANHFYPVTPRFSADGRTLFTTCDTRRCRWDISGTKPILLGEKGRETWDYGWAYSADDRLLLDTAEKSIRLLETATGRVLRALKRTIEPGIDAPFALFSADAARALFGAAPLNLEKVWIYDLKSGKAIGPIAPATPRGCPAFSPDGRLVAWVRGDGAVHLYDAATGKLIRTLRSPKPLPETSVGDCRLVFCPDGEHLIVAVYLADIPGKGYLQQPTRVFEMSSGREILRFYANPDKKEEAQEFSCVACSPDGRLLATAEKYSGTVRLIELVSGKERAKFDGHRFGVCGLAFSPDGKTLASGGMDTGVFLWDAIGARTQTAANKASDNDLSAMWKDLAADDGRRAGLAIASLLRKSDASAAFLGERLRPVEAVNEKRLTQLLADLDSDAFETREAASNELTQLGERAEAALRRALRNRPSLEVRRRIEELLNKLELAPLPPETLRAFRAIEVLEHIGTPAARRCLEALAKGAADAPQTRAAKGTLNRLAKMR